MELAFNVNAGPLTQIAIPLISIDGALQLAVGAYGWYKSRERTLTLTQALELHKASLAPSSTFSQQRYHNIRHTQGGVYGAAVNPERKLVRISLPFASTATSEKPGPDCLRALTVSLSCFLDIEQTHTVLKELLPNYLLHYEHYEDPQTFFEGPILRVLKDYIETIFGEEYVDQVRGRLLYSVEYQLPRVTGASLGDLLSSSQTDRAHITGVLAWILTRPDKRKEPVYRTRSLKVWSLCVVLGELGFEVEASKHAINAGPTNEEQGVGFQHGVGSIGKVMLVLSALWKTDIGASDFRLTSSPVISQPRITNYRAFPALAFADICPHMPKLKAEFLHEAFISTYDWSSKFFRSQVGLARAAQLPEGPFIPTEELESLDYSLPDELPRQFKTAIFMCTQFSKYIPEGGVLSAKRLESSLRHHLVKLLRKPPLQELGVEQFDCVDLLTIIQIPVFAWILSFLDLFIHREGETADWRDSDFVYIHTPVISISEVNIGENKWFRWAPRIFSMASLVAAAAKHIDADFSDNLHDARYQRVSWSNRRERIGTLITQAILGYDYPFTRSNFGVQNNGMVAISEVLLKPSLQSSSLLHYHVQVGQLIDFPVYESFVKDGIGSGVRIYHSKVLTESQSIRIQSHQPSVPHQDSLRWDFEPCWEDDPRTCCLNFRINGLSRLQLGIYELIRGIGRDYAVARDLCSLLLPCQLHRQEVSSGHHKLSEEFLGSGPNFVEVPLMDMVSQGQLVIEYSKNPSSRGTPTPQDIIPNMIVYAGNNEMLALLATRVEVSRECLPAKRAHVNCYVTDCLWAGLEAAERDMLKEAVEIQPDFRYMLIITGDDPERIQFSPESSSAGPSGSTES